MRKHDQVRGNKLSKQQLLQQQLLDSVKSYNSQSLHDEEDNNNKNIGSMFCHDNMTIDDIKQSINNQNDDDDEDEDDDEMYNNSDNDNYDVDEDNLSEKLVISDA
jgi:hypothetical protein